MKKILFLIVHNRISLSAASELVEGLVRIVEIHSELVHFLNFFILCSLKNDGKYIIFDHLKRKLFQLAYITHKSQFLTIHDF